MAPGALAGIRLVAFEARRAQELATLFARHGALVTSAPALREARLPESPPALELLERLERGEVGAVVLLTGVGTRALAALGRRRRARVCWLRWRRLPVVARGPKPLAALRELGVAGALSGSRAAHLARGARGPRWRRARAPARSSRVQEYGVPPAQLVQEIERREPPRASRPRVSLGASRGYWTAAACRRRRLVERRVRRRGVHQRGAGRAPLPRRPRR